MTSLSGDASQLGAQMYKKAMAEDIFAEEDVQVIGETKTYKDGEQIGQCEVEEIEDEVVEEQESAPEPELPQIREKKDVKMGFTEKKFAHLPARESHFKEAPYPKSKKIEKKADDVYIDIEDKDPLWLKDKGDHFYKRNDFHSALNAYCKSIENDKEFLMSRLNRATTFLRVRSFIACVDEVADIERIIDSVSKKDREEDQIYYDKIMGRALVRRAAANAWLSQFDLAVADLEHAKKFDGVFTEEEYNALDRDIESINTRKKSQATKVQGDILFATNKLSEALETYTAALEEDPHNEYALSNIGVIYLKRQDYEKCLEFTNLAL